MLLPTSYCPRCKRDALVYRSVAPDADPMTGDLGTYCADCDQRLDRFGLDPVLADKTLQSLQGLGYTRLDSAAPVGKAGCFATRGCEGCSKIESRPW